MTGVVTAFYLFDVAQEIRLAAVRESLGPRAAAAVLADKSAGPPRVSYAQPPLVIDGEALGVGGLDAFRVRVKCFDYGVLSLMLTRDFDGDWAALVALGQELIESDPLEARAIDACRCVVARLAPALMGTRAAWLQEDYLVFAVTGGDGRDADAAATLAAHGADIAQLLRGERQPLSVEEREEVLRHRLSYLADDLVVPSWNAAFVLDTPAGADVTLEWLEYVNSQLLQFRYHDELLEAELSRLYAELQRPRRFDRWTGWRHRRTARRLQALFIDVNELADRVGNAVKLTGDVWAARLVSLAAARVRLDGWRVNVQEKLQTLDAINRFAVDQAAAAQGQLLELAIVLMMLVELAVFLR